MDKQLGVSFLNFLDLFDLFFRETLAALILLDESLQLPGRVPLESLLLLFHDLVKSLLE